MSEEQDVSDFFQPMDDEGVEISGDEAILLGAPEEDIPLPAAEESNYFAAAPTNIDEYVGEIDTAPPAEPLDSAPIIVEDEYQIEVSDDVTPPTISVMAQWNNEWQVTLKERKDEENAAKAASVEKAAADLKVFHTERDIKYQSKSKKNRNDEQDKMDAIAADLEDLNSWQKVVKMVELSHDSAEGSADCGRMRDVLIFLKNDIEHATALA